MTYSSFVHDVVQGSLLDAILMWDNIRGPDIVGTVSGTPGDPFNLLYPGMIGHCHDSVYR